MIEGEQHQAGNSRKSCHSGGKQDAAHRPAHAVDSEHAIREIGRRMQAEKAGRQAKQTVYHPSQQLDGYMALNAQQSDIAADFEDDLCERHDDQRQTDLKQGAGVVAGDDVLEHRSGRDRYGYRQYTAQDAHQQYKGHISFSP